MASAARSAGFLARSVRFRLLAIALLPTLVILPLLLGVAIVRWNDKFNATLISKVNGDLTIAHQYLARILEYTSEHIKALGQSAQFRDVASGSDGAALTHLLESSREALGLDFLYLADGNGRILASAPGFASRSIRTDWPVVAAALKGAPSTAIDIFDNEELAAMSAGLAERARLELVPRRTQCRPTAARKHAAWWCIRRVRCRSAWSNAARWSAGGC